MLLAAEQSMFGSSIAAYRNADKPREEKVEPKKVETVKEEKAKVKEDLTTKTVAELRDMAKKADIKGSGTMKKAELIDALK